MFKIIFGMILDLEASQNIFKVTIFKEIHKKIANLVLYS